MIIVLEPNITAQQRQILKQFLQSRKLQVHKIVGTRQSVLGAIGKPGVRPDELAKLLGVQQVIPISKPYKAGLARATESRQHYHITCNARQQGIFIGGQRLSFSVELPLNRLITGENSVENALEAASASLARLKDAGTSILSWPIYQSYLPILQPTNSELAISSTQTLKVAFQGEQGAYSEQALRQFFQGQQAESVYPREQFNGLENVPCPDFRTMFEAVQNGRAAFAVVPLENSLAGSIMENYDLLLKCPDLCICGETRLRVSHMLIASKGSHLEQIQIVRSHPQALAQSSRFLEEHGLQPIANFDTAGSVRELKEQPKPDVAAIASVLAAEIHGMKILARAIESNPHNYTRFAIIARRDSELLQSKIQSYERQGRKFGNKWSICLRLRNFSGSLATALEIFQKYKLDLTKLESRPIMGQPWSYRFYLDTLIESGMNEAEFFRKLERISEEYHVIGRYWENLK